MPASDGGTSGTAAGWGLLEVLLAAVGAVGWRRLHPVGGAVSESEPTFAPPADDDAPAPSTDSRAADDWPFRP